MLDLLSQGRVFQVGIVVPHLEPALDLYTRALGLGPWVRYHYTPDNVTDFTYRGQPANYSIEIALTGDSPQIELIEVHGESSLYHEWIETRGYGLHHVGVRVESIHDLTADMVSAGYDLLQSGHGYGLDGDGGFAYFDTVDDFGIILEGIEVPRRRRPPDGVWPPTS